ncbi:phage baseplate assembly protein V [Gimesia algae]|uniref:Phage-related baseplate assembly protein n=1 Tax=Gimesia algae TaxID=2527971 RepID=A0A517VBS9_9PLAN|nr:phage baseplate assembly protein V [Gimesia algae]QDT90458.1 Phage-related baseplate assembly protein [Gimesia algae]
MSIETKDPHTGIRTYLGKYRGTVINNVDPLNKGRLMVQVPDVLGTDISTWALPCLPLAGPNNGFYALPIMGSGVWVEFEQGDPDYPIWVGCFWGSAAEVPALAKSIPPLVPGITLQTPLGNGISISDVPGPTGGITLSTATGARIMINDLGIFIENGRGATLKMVGNMVDINDQALTVL